MAMLYQPSKGHCFHCNEPVPNDSDWTVRYQDETFSLCCAGCEAVSKLLIENQLDSFYQLRTGPARKPTDLVPEELNDLIQVSTEQRHATSIKKTANISEAELAIEGITCAACAWLIESHLNKVQGIVECRMNAVTQRLHVSWNSEKLNLDQIINAIRQLGFDAFVYQPSEKQQHFQAQNRAWLLRIGVAALCSMQTMMLSLGLYIGDASDIANEHQVFLRWINALLVLPILLYSAKPFYRSAKHALLNHRINIDVAVSIAVTLAYCASVYATITNAAEVYFDSVGMFTLLLLVGRFFEHKIRYKVAIAGQQFQRWLPQTVERASGKSYQRVAVESLVAGDSIRISEGDVIPADGFLVSERASVDQAFLTGEFASEVKLQGSELLAGSVNLRSPIIMQVDRVGADTKWADLVRLQQRVESEKPAFIGVLDKAAQWFVGTILIIAAVVGVAWWSEGPMNALWIVVSVLIVSCPCALSLAAPVSLTCALKKLVDQSVLVIDQHWLEQLAKIDHIVFDKTGTLTHGELSIERVVNFEEHSASEVTAIASCIEQGSRHPVARALSKKQQSQYELVEQELVAGAGVIAVLREISSQALTRYYLGHGDFIRERINNEHPELMKSGVFLANEHELLGRFDLADTIRPSIDKLIPQLDRLGIQVHLVSGDPSSEVDSVAAELGIEHVTKGAAPKDKVDYIARLQQQGNTVLMVGDGVNDAAVLSQANASVAMGSGVFHSKDSAGAVLANDQLHLLPDMIKTARDTLSIIKQNIAWALGYNLLAIPFAALGWVPPWAAAIGMTISSLLVLANAMRLLTRTSRTVSARTGILKANPSVQ